MIAIEHCHSQGIVHGDLKTESLLLNGDFTLKITEFGLASLLSGREKTEKLYPFFGTEEYMAPEILMQKLYDGIAADLFACAVILFVMVSGSFPFYKADPFDPLYQYIYSNEADKFWQKHEKHLAKESETSIYSEEFKDFLSTMFSFDPSWRLTIAEIKAHPWYNGSTISPEELRKEFKARKEVIDKIRQKEREAKKKGNLIIQLPTLIISPGACVGIKPSRGGFSELENVIILTFLNLTYRCVLHFT